MYRHPYQGMIISVQRHQTTTINTNLTQSRKGRQIILLYALSFFA